MKKDNFRISELYLQNENLRDNTNTKFAKFIRQARQSLC